MALIDLIAYDELGIDLDALIDLIRVMNGESTLMALINQIGVLMDKSNDEMQRIGGMHSTIH